MFNNDIIYTQDRTLILSVAMYIMTFLCVSCTDTLQVI